MPSSCLIDLPLSFSFTTPKLNSNSSSSNSKRRPAPLQPLSLTQRLALFRESKRLATAYMPYKYRGHRYVTDLAHPWVQGYRRPLFAMHWWECVDIVGASPSRPE